MKAIKIIPIIILIFITISLLYFLSESTSNDEQEVNQNNDIKTVKLDDEKNEFYYENITYENNQKKIWIESTIENVYGEKIILVFEKLKEQLIEKQGNSEYLVIEARSSQDIMFLHVIDDENGKHIKYIEMENSELFRKLLEPRELVYSNGELTPLRFTFLPINDSEKLFKEIGVSDDENTSLFIIPTFTASAYSEPGFYSYYRGDCDTELHDTLFRDEDCLTTNLMSENKLDHNSSESGVQILKLLGYSSITDLELHNNPEILKKYDKIILLHNEYVSRIMFDSIISHDNVIFLYPNALYAEVDVNTTDNTITLVRGHNYPDITIRNGFDWIYDNTHPYEYDKECKNWKFYSIPNGHMLNCYPENIIWEEKDLLKMLKDF